MRTKEPDLFVGTTDRVIDLMCEYARELSDEQLQRLFDAMDIEIVHRINVKARKEAGYTE